MLALRDLLFVPQSGSRDDHQRSLAARATLAITSVGFCLSMAGAFTLPILFGTDERVHLAYVEVLLRGDLPEVDTDVPVDGHVDVLADYYQGDAAGAGAHGDVWVANHPPLTYLVAAPLVWLTATVGYANGPPMVLRIMCALGMLAGALATAAVADALLPGQRRAAVLAAGLVALTPGLVSIGSHGYNDGAAFGVGTALLAVILRVTRYGPTRERLIAIIVLGSAATLVRGALLPLVPLAALVWLVTVWPSARRRAVTGALLAMAVPLLAGGWFYVRNQRLYGGITGSAYLQEKFGRERAGSTIELLANPQYIIGAWQDIWASYRLRLGLGSGHGGVGSPEVEIGTRLITGAVLLFLALVGWAAGLARRSRPTRAGLATWAVAAAWVGLTVVGFASFVSGGGSPHPRYLFPAHSVVAVFLIGGLVRLPRGRAIAGAVLLGIICVNLVLFSRLSAFLLQSPFPAQFSQPGLSTVVVLLAFGGAVAAGLDAARSLRAVEDRPSSPSEVDGSDAR